MCSKLFFTLILVSVAIGLGLGKTCTKEQRYTYVTWKMDPYTQRLALKPQAYRRIHVLCCPGYTEVGREGMKPLCEPNCQLNCVGGFCDVNNQCICHEGYRATGIGHCELEELSTTTTTMPNTTTTTPWDTTKMPNTTSTMPMPNTTTTTPWHTTKMPNTTSMATTTAKPTATPITTARPTTTTANPTTTTKNTARPTTTTATTTPHPIATSTTTPRTAATTPALSSSNPKENPVEIPMAKVQLLQREEATTIQIPTDQIQPQSAPDKHLSIEPRFGPVPATKHLKGLECEDNINCACPSGYTLDSQSYKCRPLCNGKIYGCISGTCIGVNQCRCDEDTYLDSGELFHCRPAHFHWKWTLLLLLIPAALITIGFYIAMRRWRKAKAHRLDAQGECFAEVRLHSTTNHSIDEKNQWRRRSSDSDNGEDEVSLGAVSNRPMLMRKY